MKNLTLLLLLVILLAGCQSPATPEPSPGPVEALADSTSDLIGIWWFSQSGAFIEFNDDGTLRVFSGSKNIGNLDSGSFSFDTGKVTFLPGTNSVSLCEDPATYEAYITSQDGNPVSIRMQVVGNDSCTQRADILANPGRIHNP